MRAEWLCNQSASTSSCSNIMCRNGCFLPLGSSKAVGTGENTGPFLVPLMGFGRHQVHDAMIVHQFAVDIKFAHAPEGSDGVDFRHQRATGASGKMTRLELLLDLLMKNMVVFPPFVILK